MGKLMLSLHGPYGPFMAPMFLATCVLGVLSLATCVSNVVPMCPGCCPYVSHHVSHHVPHHVGCYHVPGYCACASQTLHHQWLHMFSKSVTEEQRFLAETVRLEGVR